MEKALSGLSIR